MRSLVVLIAVAAPLLGGAPNGAAAAPPGAAGWQAPVMGPVEVLRGFQAPPEPWAAGHRGVDLAAGPGAVILAASDGWVSFAGPVAGRSVVSIDHRRGSGAQAHLRTTYEPVDAVVSIGEPVRQGQVIGTLQAGGSHCVLPCLHWGLRDLAAEADAERSGGPLAGAPIYRDPMALLRRAQIRLLPRLGAPVPGSRSSDALATARGPSNPEAQAAQPSTTPPPALASSEPTPPRSPRPSPLPASGALWSVLVAGAVASVGWSRWRN
jgi:murein DD-endopeptidase MepM/ murein hydrolase activator NlpD